MTASHVATLTQCLLALAGHTTAAAVFTGDAVCALQAARTAGSKPLQAVSSSLSARRLCDIVLNPPEDARTYSSRWGSDESHVLSMLDSAQAWSAAENVAGEWIQIDLGSVKMVGGVVTQGRNLSSPYYPGHKQYVTKYTVSTATDPSSFQQQGGTYLGNHDNMASVSALLPAPVMAQYIRIYPTAWNKHISLRAGVLSCTPTPSPTPGSPVTPTPFPTVSPLEAGGWCNIQVNPPEDARTYSTVWRRDNRHTLSMLDSAQAWSAGQNEPGEWVQIDLGSVRVVGGVLTQGRNLSSPWGRHEQYVTKYTVSTAMDPSSFEQQGGEYIGNQDCTDRVGNQFPAPVLAQYVRIYVTDWYRHISMRAGVLECPPTPSPTPAPTPSPTLAPTTLAPTPSPTLAPTSSPTGSPSSSPTSSPTGSPTSFPSSSPTSVPTGSPTSSPSFSPTSSPTGHPTSSPSYSPTSSPSSSPTYSPSYSPTMSPSSSPTFTPSYSPTSSPTGSPTHSPTSSPTPHNVATSFGDPHVTNLKGERFDILQTDYHTFLVIPRGADEEHALLHVVAKVDPLGQLCSGLLYVTSLRFAGRWVGDVGSLEFTTSVDAAMQAEKAMKIKAGASSLYLNASQFREAVPRSLAEVTEFRPQEPQSLNQHVDLLLVKLKLGPSIAKVRMVYQKEKFGFSNSLWLTTTGLGHVDKEIGGILGFDDHTFAASKPKKCVEQPDEGAASSELLGLPTTPHGSVHASATLEDVDG